MSEILRGLCENCGWEVRYDMELTLEAYKEDEERVAVLPSYFEHNYLVYVCVKCGLPTRLTYQQIELFERKKLAKIRERIRMFETGQVFEIDRNKNSYLKQIDANKAAEKKYYEDMEKRKKVK
jgi:RNase P subunit RPR2